MLLSQQCVPDRVVVENNSLSGDQAREAAKQAAEVLKKQVREKLGDGTTSAIANAIINGLTDTGDAALGSADYAADAATGELAARAFAGMLYPGVKDLSTLTEGQKQTVSTLATIAAGMAGGLAGDSTGSAVVGGQAGKNAAENNTFGKDKIFDINPMLKIGIEGAERRWWDR